MGGKLKKVKIVACRDVLFANPLGEDNILLFVGDNNKYMLVL